MRKFAALLFLVAVAVLIWYAARWRAGERPLEATLVFDAPVAVRPNNSVLHDGVRIGRIASVASLGDDRKAVVIEVHPDWRHVVRSDSTFRPAADGDRAAIEVSSRFAVGPPLSDGAVIAVETSRWAAWLDKGAEMMRPVASKVASSANDLVAWYESGKFDQSLDDWRKKVPSWRAQGGDVFEKNLESIRQRVAAAEQKLRDAGRDVDADQLRRKFDDWVKRLGENR